MFLIPGTPPPPPTRKILFLRKRNSVIRENCVNVNTWRIASTAFLTLQRKNDPIILILLILIFIDKKLILFS